MFELLLERREVNYRRTFGQSMAVGVNSQPFRGENAKQFSPTDFFPDHNQPEEESDSQTPEQQASILKAFFSRFKQKKP